MGKTVQVTCDGCGLDITRRSNCVDYRLVLSSESKPGHGAGFYTAAMIYPPVDRTHYFCGLGCLDHWRAREHHKGQLWKEWWKSWKDERGTKHPDGRIYSFPEPPEETTAACKVEFETAALAAFPMKAAHAA